MPIKSPVPFFLLALALPTAARADVFGNIGKFSFVAPGVVITKDGLGLELSAGQNGHDDSKSLLMGGLARYEFEGNRKEAGLELGFIFLLLEFGVSFSDRGNGPFIVPDICIPIPGSDKTGMNLNLFYRMYPSLAKASTLGASLKFAFMWD